MVNLYAAVAFLLADETAVMVHSPADRAVTLPVLSTEATFGLELVNESALFLAFSGTITGLRVSVSPRFNVLDVFSACRACTSEEVGGCVVGSVGASVGVCTTETEAISLPASVGLNRKTPTAVRERTARQIKVIIAALCFITRFLSKINFQKRQTRYLEGAVFTILFPLLLSIINLL